MLTRSVVHITILDMLKQQLSIFKSLPFQLIFIFVFSFLFGEWVPTAYKEISYALSLSIKEGLIFILPFIVFSYLFSCILELRKGAVTFIIGILICVCLSNFISTLIAYSVGRGITPVLSHITSGNQIPTAILEPFWFFSLPKWISNDTALFSGLLLGWMASFLSSPPIRKIANTLKSAAHTLLAKLFIPIVPIFILGFAMKLQHEGTLKQTFLMYGPVFALIAGVEIIYISFLFGVSVQFRMGPWIQSLKTIFPSALSGFSTMSSAASLPMTLAAAEKNSGEPELARAIVPATVNAHLMGDSIAIPLTAFVILSTFGHPFPTFETYIVFALYFILAKFAVAAVPGGGILIMIPILEKHLGFTPEMLSLITTVYLLFDPLITACNVSGNGAFAVLFSKVLKRMSNKVVTA